MILSVSDPPSDTGLDRGLSSEILFLSVALYVQIMKVALASFESILLLETSADSSALCLNGHGGIAESPRGVCISRRKGGRQQTKLQSAVQEAHPLEK